MATVFRIGPAVIRLECLDATGVAGVVRQPLQPGAGLHIITGHRVDPGGMQQVPVSEVESLNKSQDVLTSSLPPTDQVCIGHAAAVGID